ncbi:NPCBM/NEW2 domain-containing protein [Micromonospora sp. NPDC004336]
MRRDVVLTTSPCWVNDKFTVTFVVSRQFRVLEATVGLADDSPVALPLRFTVLADRKAVFTTTVGLGKVRPLRVDIGDATQVSLQVGTTSVDQCHGDSIGVWIAPRVRR